jgi:PA14 domain
MAPVPTGIACPGGAAARGAQGQIGEAKMSGESRTRRIENALFIVPFLTYGYFYQGSDQSTAARFDLMRSALEHRALWIDGFCGYNTADIIHLSGHYYSVKAPGTSLVALIPWALLRVALMPLLRHNEPLYWAILTYLTIVLTTGLLMSIATVVMFRFAKYLGATEGRAAGCALIFALATIVFPYATELTGEPFAAGFALLAFYLVATCAADARALRSFAAGLCAGLAVLNDYPTLLVAAAIGFYALYRLPDWRAVVAFSSGAAIIAVLMIAYNWLAFGAPLFFSYEAFKLPGNTQFPEQARGFVGLTYPKVRILWDILADPQRGLFFCNPVLLMAIPATGYFFRIGKWRAEWAVTVFSFSALILFNASYGESIVSWGGGTATGPRQIVAAIPFMVLALAFLPKACDWLLGGLAVLSVFIMLAATATNPHFPYEYENPVRDFAMQQFLRGDFASNRDAYFGGGMIMPDSVAFNLGKFVGLPGPIQLWPLGIFWVIGAVELTNALRLWKRPEDETAGTIAIAVAISAVFIAPSIGALQRPLGLRARHGLLGRYFVGDRPGETAPQIVRIDRVISLDNVTAMGAMPFPSVAVWTGRLIVPRGGNYRFVVEADDAGWLSIDGRAVIADPGDVNRPRAEGTIYLRPGLHRIMVGERNLAGDASIHLSWQPPGGDLDIVPSQDLLPDHAN